MVNAKDVVSHPLRAIDAIGYPFVRVAHSRKVMKGEDKSFASPDVVWTPARVDGDGAEGCSASPPPSSCHFSVFGLFDGHGGKAAAEHCAETLVPCILDALDARGPIARDDDAEDALEERLPAALVDAFAASDAQFLLKDIHSGATATIVCVNGRCVTSAAVGDSLATIDTGSHHHHNSTKSSGGASSASRLTPEHRLDTSASERNRIEAAGGEVRATAFEEGKPVGPLRVWPGGLAVSRSMGDRDGKKGGAFYLTPVPIRPRLRGVISEPEVSRVVVPDHQPGFRIVLASDGLWDAVTVKQASSCGAKLGTQAAAAALCKLAQKQKDNRDDITVVVCDFLADASHRDPFQAKPPWRTELDVRWPFGKKKYDPSPPPSTRRAARMAAERAEADAIAAAREARVAAETEEAARAAARAATVAELERYEHERESARDGGGGWEEVGGGHAAAAAEAAAAAAAPVVAPPPPKKKQRGKEKGGGGGGAAEKKEKNKPEKTGKGRRTDRRQHVDPGEGSSVPSLTASPMKSPPPKKQRGKDVETRMKSGGGAGEVGERDRPAAAAPATAPPPNRARAPGLDDALAGLELTGGGIGDGARTSGGGAEKAKRKGKRERAQERERAAAAAGAAAATAGAAATPPSPPPPAAIPVASPAPPSHDARHDHHHLLTQQQQHGFHDQQQMQQRMQTQYEHHHRTHHQQTHHPQMRQPQMQQHSPQQVAYLAQHHEMAARMRQQHEQQMQQQEMLANLQRQRMAQQGQYSTRGPGPFSFSPPSSSPPPPRPHPHPPSSSNGVARELDAPAAGAGVGAKTKPKRKGKRERAQERARLIAESGGGTS